MTVSVLPPEEAQNDRGVATGTRSWAAWAARSGWVPTGLLFIGTGAVLHFYGVALLTIGVFTAYVGLGLALPGTLLWRVAQRGSRSLVEDVAAGLAVGYAMEVLTYLPARAVGMPLLVLVSPVAVVGVFLAVPGLRRYWRTGRDTGRTPALWSWSMAGLIGLLVLWSSGKIFLIHGLNWPYNASPDPDMPFHLAIIGETKHHMPPSIPFVRGEPLLYHWFVYAEMAATSWVTGIEPQTLLYRLSLLPMLAAFVVMIAVIARRLTGCWWTGPVASMVTLFVLAPNPYGWPLPDFFAAYYGFGVVDDGSLLRPVLWASTTQTFGALLFTPVVLLLMDLLDGRRRDVRRWTLFGLLLVAVMGAKATYLPLLLAALLFVLGCHGMFKRGLHRPALIASIITVPCLLFAQLVLFGGATQGLKLDPFSTMRVWAMSQATHLATGEHPPLWRPLLLTALFVVCWACIWGGVAGLGRRLVEPGILLLLGLGLGGIGAITLFGHSGLSQGFFFQSARPYLAIAAVCGFAAMVRRMTMAAGLWLVGAGAVGGVALLLVRVVDGATTPTMASGARRVALALTWPYLLFVVLVAVVAAAVVAVRRWLGGSARSHWLPTVPVAALVVAMLAGAGLTSGVNRLTYTIHNAWSNHWRSVQLRPTSIAKGAQEAGRWLRDHSDPDDLVATNAHCQAAGTVTCGNEHVWIAGYTERRVLVEGWAFTNTVHVKAVQDGIPDGQVPYWRPQVLTDNDAAFTDPSEQTIGRLMDHYHVRWLFVDERQSQPPAVLATLAQLRYRSGTCVIYELRH